MHKLIDITIDRLTPALRTVKREVRKILSHYPEFVSLGEIPFRTIKEVLESLGFKMSDEMDSNGWYYDTWVRFHNHDKKITYTVESSWYDSRITITKEKYDSRRS